MDNDTDTLTPPAPHTTRPTPDPVPACQYPHDVPVPATVDGATRTGPWAFMCDAHHAVHGYSLGLGRGQRFV